MRIITGYTLTVKRGARAGLVRHYAEHKRVAARRFADKLDLEYGAICCTVSPIFAELVQVEQRVEYTCTPASIAAEHQSDMASLGIAL